MHVDWTADKPGGLEKRRGILASTTSTRSSIAADVHTRLTPAYDLSEFAECIGSVTLRQLKGDKNT